MAKLAVQVTSVVVQLVAFNPAKFDDEDALCEEAREEVESELQDAGFVVSHSTTLVKWEDEE